jgi:hypothetical protein
MYEAQLLPLSQFNLAAGDKRVPSGQLDESKLYNLIQDYTANKLWPTIERLDKVVALHLEG